MKKIALKTKYFYSLLIYIFPLILISFDLPTAWYKTGDSPNSYEMGVDKGKGPGGSNAATIKSLDRKLLKQFGALAQTCSACEFSGKTIRLKANVKTENVVNSSGIWLRADNICSGESKIENMSDRPIKGSTAWKNYEITLDIPENTTTISYGAFLAGTGQIWFSNVKIEIIGIISHDGNNANKTQTEPRNLNFQEIN